jgi:ABC-type dipeptide/oligopeptide/nickel transport system permease component
VVKNKKVAVKTKESDSQYFLKMVFYLIAGSIWLRISKDSTTIPFPIGLLLGIWFARMDKFQIDRKIEYAILLVSAFISFWLPIGLEIVL